MHALYRGRGTLGTSLAGLLAHLQSWWGRGGIVAAAKSGVLTTGDLRLRGAVSAMQDGFGLFDAEDRIILHNAAFMDEGSRKMFGDDVTGRKFEEIVRAFAYNDMPVDDLDFDRESWIAQRMERHRNPPAHPIEVEWGGGRWMRI
ncbi:MAG TPA: PAS-domain containing protein, partial [Dongiaceae bacterium]|nr:PAS-domain containing protein [Dongiaceae bacterium]